MNRKSVLLSLLVVLSIFIAGCVIDFDRDGYFSNIDCDDRNPNVNPGAAEVCNGIDDNCDGRVDEGCACSDNDNDRFTTCDGDCDDNNAMVNPSAEEICNNGIDENCDGAEEGCVSCSCPELYSPVCGSDGVTYANQCEADCKNVEVLHSGECACGDNFVTPPEECDPTAPTPPFYCGDEEMCRSCKCVSGVEGVIEGESLVGRSTATGGTILEQDMTSFEGSWSNGAQLWWIDGKPGDSISIPFDVAESGYYDVKVRLTKAVDYGRFELYVGNFPLFVDLYNDGVIPSDEISLGKFNLEARTHYIGAGILGSNPQAVPSYMFGLDYISVKEAFH